MQRSIVSRGSETFFAASIAMRSFALSPGSAPPFAAMISSFATFENALPFALEVARRPACFH
jgi:hypothetical protein